MINKKAVFLSTDNLQNFFTYDKLLIPTMKEAGWTVEEISWRNEKIDWNKFDAVIVRSTWDYQNDPEKFIEVLETINNSSAHLENNLELMRWNMNKKYLYDLEQKNVRIVKTIWEKSFDENKLESYFLLLNSDEIIIKPNISANADNTFRISQNDLASYTEILKRIFMQKEFMVQPFMKNIVAEGEYSLFFFNGQYSHCILKKPKEKDFRVQEEHGGTIVSVVPSHNQISICKNIIMQLTEVPLYARIDLVRAEDNNFELMELELIEPSLYFNMDNQSPIRFTEAFLDKTKNI